MNEKMKKNLKEYVPYFLIIIIVILIRTFIITPVRVTGDSMDYTLKDGQIMLLYKLNDIKRYDIVVVKNAVKGEEIIKRVIGMPGDSIEMVDGKLYINDEEVEDIYAYYTSEDNYYLCGDSKTANNFDKVYLWDNEYFVLGDNRSVSYDSRCFGKIKREDIVGTANFRIFPFNKFGRVEK